MLSIRNGEADLMLAGGTSEDVDVFALMGFSLLGVLSRNNSCPKEASRPFDAKRDGFVLSEGMYEHYAFRYNRSIEDEQSPDTGL